MRMKRLADGQNKAVGEAFKMSPPTILVVHHIVQHLHRLGVVQWRMLVLAHDFRQIGMDELAQKAPLRCCIHPQQVISARQKLLAKYTGRPTA